MTATTVPKAASTESTKPIAAVTGTRIERKTSSSSTIASVTTTRPNGSSASCSRCETSICTAVAPVTEMGVPWAASISGAAARIARTSSAVAWSVGPVSAITWMIAVSAVSSGKALPMRSTPGIARRSAEMSSRTPRMSVTWVMSAITTSGPVVPSPKPSCSRS